jgi:hypothetical protein
MRAAHLRSNHVYTCMLTRPETRYASAWRRKAWTVATTAAPVDGRGDACGNLIFVAAVELELCGTVELEPIWQGRNVLTYNNIGKRKKPELRLSLFHQGDAPTFTVFEDLTA